MRSSRCRELLLSVLFLASVPGVEVVTVVASDDTAAESSPASGAFTVSRAVATGSPLEVAFFMSGTARSIGQRDYDVTTGTSGAVTIPAGQTSAVVTISPVSDAIHEPDETAILTLVSSPTYSLGGATIATVTIVDDDPVPTATVAKINDGFENSPGSLGRFRITLSNPASPPPTISFTIGGTATADADYRPMTNTVTYLSELASTADVVVFLNRPIGSLYNDAVFEGTETVVLALQPGAGYVVGTPASATVSITDDEQPPKIDLSVTDATAAETGPDSGAFVVSTAQPVSMDTTVNLSYATSSAVGGADHPVLPTQVTIPAGSAGVSVVVTPIDDTLNEGPFPETVVVAVLSGTGYGLGNVLTGTIAIADNDLPTGTLRFTASNYTANEGSPPIASVAAGLMVERVGGSAGSASLTWATSDGTASAGSDYTAASGTLTWNDGEGGLKPITITLLPDALIEANETLIVSLSGASGAALGGPATAELTISNDDVSTAGQLRFTVASLAVAEGSSGGTTSAVINVERLGGSTGSVTVGYATAAGTAAAGSDFTAASGTLTWADGDAAVKSFVLPIAADGTAESDELLTISLSSPTGGAVLGTQATLELTIVNDDGGMAGTVAFIQASTSFAEGSSDRVVSIPVARSGGSSGAVGVSYTFTNGSAANGTDFLAVAGSLSWPSGDTSPRTIQVTITGDDVIEPDKAFTISLSAPTGGATVGPVGSAVVTIANDDVPAIGTISFSAGSTSAQEGNTGTIAVPLTVRRTAGSAGAVSVAYGVAAGGTASAGADFQPAGGTLAWADGDATDRSILVTVMADTVHEGDETIRVALGTPSGGAVLGTGVATITIVDDDPAPGSASGGGGAAGGGGGCGAGAASLILLVAACMLAIAKPRRRG